jgi:putative oxidoreductase
MLRDWTQWPQVPLRIGVGLCLIYDSAPWVFTRAGHDNFTHMLDTVGLPLPWLMAWGVGLLEFFGGVALVLGAFMNVVSLLLAVEIATRLIGFWVSGGVPAPLPGQRPINGYEQNLMYIAALLVLYIAGAGRPSVDRAIQVKEGRAY